MKTLAIVVADDPVYASWLENAAGDQAEFSLVRAMDAEDLIERVQLMGQVDVAFFQFDSDNLKTQISMLERLAEHIPDLPIAGLGADNNPDIVLAAMRAGARDFLVLRRDEGDVSALLTKLLRRAMPVARGETPKDGKLFTVISAHPVDATAFVAEHIALAAAEELGRSRPVLLVDVASPAGAASIFLNVNLSYSVLDAINDVYRCDQTLVETAFFKHYSGLYLLSLPEDLIGPPQANFEDLGKLLQVLRTLFSCVVVACDGHLPISALADIVAAADRNLLLSDQSIIRSRHSKYLLSALRSTDCALDRVSLLVDNYRRRMGLEPENLADILDIPIMGTLSASGGDNRSQAMNTGEPMFALAPKDPFCVDVRQLASTLIGGKEHMAQTAPNVLSRWFK